jgi:hypothetical protein
VSIDRFKCPSTGKRGYKSRHDAKVIARRMGEHYTVYRCPAATCRAYHVTHYPERIQKAIAMVKAIR